MLAVRKQTIRQFLPSHYYHHEGAYIIVFHGVHCFL